MSTSVSGFTTACGRNSTALITLKIAVLTPMPSPRITTAASVNFQSRASRRTPCRVSRRR
jgi:hypothetical protein